MRTKAESARLQRRMEDLLEELHAAKKCEKKMKIEWLKSQINIADCEDAIDALIEKMRNPK